MKNINDPKVVIQRLEEIDKINERGMALQEENLTNIRDNYGKAPLNTTPQRNVKPALGKETQKDPLGIL